MNCPECSGKLEGGGTRYTCGQCETVWEVRFSCEECHEAPEMESHCGAVSFFCKTCKKLKSRETMEKEFTKVES